MAKELEETAENGQLLLEDKGYKKGFQRFKAQSFVQPPADEISPKCSICKTVNQFFINKQDWLVEKSQFHRQDEALLEFCDSVQDENVSIKSNCIYYAKMISTLAPLWKKGLTAYKICARLNMCKEGQVPKYKVATGGPVMRGILVKAADKSESFIGKFLHKAGNLVKSAGCKLCEQAAGKVLTEATAAAGETNQYKNSRLLQWVNKKCRTWVNMIPTVLSVCDKLEKDLRNDEVRKKEEPGQYATELLKKTATEACTHVYDSCRDIQAAKPAKKNKK